MCGVLLLLCILIFEQNALAQSTIKPQMGSPSDRQMGSPSGRQMGSISLQYQLPESADLSRNEETAGPFCNIAHTLSMPYEQNKQILLDACSRDTQCASLFYQTKDWQNARLFEHLLGSTLTHLRGDLLKPLRELFCPLNFNGNGNEKGNVSIESIGVTLAMHTLMARRHFDQPVCGVHHVPRFDQKTGATTCILASDQSTQSSACNYSWVIGIMSIGIAVFACVNLTMCIVNKQILASIFKSQ